MRRSLLMVACSIALVIAPVPAFGGDLPDPNVDDVALGKAGGIRYASESKPVDIGSGYSQTVAGCGGPRWHLIGGGARADGDASAARLSFGRPFDYLDAGDAGDDGWFAGGYGPNASTLTGYSICIRDTALRYRQVTAADDTDGLRTALVGCGGPRWHLTSGSPFIATSQSWLGSSFPLDGDDADTVSDDLWKGSVYDTVGGAGGFYVHAVCTSEHTLRYVRRPPVTVAAGTTDAMTVACRVDEHVVGGGARIGGPVDQARLVATFPDDGGDADTVPDDGWRVVAFNITGGDKDVTAFAICLS